MVFSNLQVITGVVLSQQEFEKHVLNIYVDDLNKYDSEGVGCEIIDGVISEGVKINVDEDPCYEISNETILGEVKVHSYGCCSSLDGKVWIVGYVSRTYPRKNAHCGKQVTPRSYCSADSRLCCDDCIKQFIHNTYEVEQIRNEVVTAPKSHFCGHCGADNQRRFETCKVCNYEFHRSYRGEKGVDLKKVLKKWGITTLVTNIYMLDGCTSCT